MTLESLDEDVARLRAKWFGAGTTPPRALDAEEEAIAAKWLGNTEARKLAETGSGKKYRPPVVVGHYGYIPRASETYYERTFGIGMSMGDYWYLEVFTSGQKETVFQGDKMACMQAVARMQRMGISVTRVGGERAPEEVHGHQKPSSVRSKRFDANWLREATRG